MHLPVCITALLLLLVVAWLLCGGGQDSEPGMGLQRTFTSSLAFTVQNMATTSGRPRTASTPACSLQLVRAPTIVLAAWCWA